MLIEFERVDGSGSGYIPPRMIGIEPNAVGAVHDSTRVGVSIIRLFDGRGYLVKGDYRQVSAMLAGQEPEPSEQSDGVRRLSVVPHDQDDEGEDDLEDSETD